MPRTLEFKREDALDTAMKVFWTNGFKATSMADLEKATGLNPGSIYNAFGSKKGLFIQATDHYRKTIVGVRIAEILEQGEPLEAIEAFFRTTYEDFEPDQLIGCMLTNTATEISDSDAEIQERVAEGISVIERAFLRRLQDAQATGAFDPQADATQTALHLTSCFQGLSVIGRLTRDKKRLKVIVDQALASLEPRKDAP